MGWQSIAGCILTQSNVTSNLEVPVDLVTYFWTVGGSQSICRNTPHTQSRGWYFSPRSWKCETTVMCVCVLVCVCIVIHQLTSYRVTSAAYTYVWEGPFEAWIKCNIMQDSGYILTHVWHMAGTKTKRWRWHCSVSVKSSVVLYIGPFP